VSGNPKSPWTPEVFGDAFLVNGKLFPYLEVEPRPYRFRVLNGANGASSSVAVERPVVPSDRHRPGLALGASRTQAPKPRPRERADLIVDFSSSAGEPIILKNDISFKRHAIPRRPQRSK